MLASPALILASTSRYPRDLLERLRLPFDVHSPEVVGNETCVCLFLLNGRLEFTDAAPSQPQG